jgi:hypothetical protein
MITVIKDGVIWDDEKPMYQQSPDAQALIAQAMDAPAIKRTYETCLEDKRRTTLRRYQLTDSLTLDVIPVYNTGPMEREFMGMSDFKYLIQEA